MSCQKSDLPELKLSDDFVSLMTFKDFNKGSEKNKVCILNTKNWYSSSR